MNLDSQANSLGVAVVVVEAGGENTEREGTETVVDEPVEDSAAVEEQEMVAKDLCTNSAHNTYTGRAEDSPGVVVGVVVVVEEAEGAVETERGGWEVGGTAENEKEGEGLAAVRVRLFQLEPTLYYKTLTVSGADSCPWNAIFSYISIFFWVF